MAAIDLDMSAFFRLSKAMKAAAKEMEDLRVPLGEIHKSFIKSRKFIFTLKGKGQYVDLKESYKRQKRRKHGHVYPILKATGRLMDSITTDNEDHYKRIEKKALTIGTSVPYAVFLQNGTRKMPARPFLFWGPETKKFSNHRVVEKQTRHMAMILYNHIERSLGADPSVAIRKAGRKVDRLFNA